MPDFLKDLRELQPSKPLIRFGWASFDEEDGEFLEACPITQLCLQKELVTEQQLGITNDAAGIIYAAIFYHYGPEAVGQAQAFIGEWDKRPRHFVNAESIPLVVKLVEEFYP